MAGRKRRRLTPAEKAVRSEAGKAVFAARAAAGLCRRCGRRPKGIGGECEGCAAKSAAYQKAKRAARTKAGLCRQCGAPQEGGFTLCGPHMAAARAATRRFEAKKRGK